MAGRLIGAWSPALDGSGAPISGAKLYTYVAGTTTPKTTYTTVALSTPQTNPVVADSAGRFPEIWAADGAAYDLKWTDAASVQIELFEDIQTLGATATGAVMRDFGADGRLNLQSRGGTTFLEGGPASPDDIGGAVRIGGWGETQADTFVIDAAAITYTNPAAARAATGQGLTKLAGGTQASAVASFWITLPPGYSRYRIELEDIYPVTTGQDLVGQFSIDNRANSIATLFYYSGEQRFASGTETSLGNSGTATGIALTRTQTSTATTGSIISIEIKQNTATKAMAYSADGAFLDNNGTPTVMYAGGGRALGAPATDILLVYSAGNIASISKWTLYGYE